MTTSIQPDYVRAAGIRAAEDGGRFRGLQGGVHSAAQGVDGGAQGTELATALDQCAVSWEDLINAVGGSMEQQGRNLVDSSNGAASNDRMVAESFRRIAAAPRSRQN